VKAEPKNARDVGIAVTPDGSSELATVGATTVGLRFFFCALVLLLWPMAWWQRHGWPVHRFVPPWSFLEHGGVAYQAAIPLSFFTERLTDSANRGKRSDLRLFEGSTELGPNHATVGAVESHGGGGFSDWKGSVVLSASDNSNPRKNGRLYSAVYRAYPSAAAQVAYVVVCAIAGLAGAEVVLLLGLRPWRRPARWTGAQARHVGLTTTLYGAGTLLVVLSLHGLNVRAVLSPSEIGSFGGSAYSAGLPATVAPLFAASADDAPGGSWSDMRITEDGLPLGPPHAPHAQIRSERLGAYSHWGNGVVFSAPDGSDPRDNGRTYEVAYRIFLVPAVAWWGLALCGGVVVLRLMQHRRSVARDSRFRPAAVQALADTNRGVAASLLRPSSLLRLGGLVVAYTFVVLILYGSLVARESDTDGFKINFEYKAF